MKRRVIYRLNWAIPTSLLIVFALVGCQPPAPTQAPQATAIPISGATQAPATSPEVASPTPASPEAASPTVSAETTATPQPAPSPSPDVLFRDDFTNPATGWDQGQLGNYYVGYHSPDWYHIEIDSANEKVQISEPNKKDYGDVTLELEVFAAASKTSPTGDYREGLVFRRSGDNYYAFTVSPVSKKWALLKGSSSGIEVLKEGTDDSIHGPDGKDVLHVDAMGPNYFLSINGHNVALVTDASYTTGQVGLYAQTLDSPKIHIHYDTFTIQKAPTEPPDIGLIFKDDFTNPATGWDQAQLGDSYVGYHSPDWYHIEIDSANEKVPLSEPNKKDYGDVTLELEVFAAASKTSPTGDYREGLVFRRSGDNYYAFTVSPVSKKWAFLKVSPGTVEVLKEGTDDSIHGPDGKDILRVDAMGSNFLLHINGHYVDPVTDASYTTGQVGLYAQTLDSPKIHIHFDTFSIHELKLDFVCNITGDTVYARSGPGKDFAQIAILHSGDTVQALGKSSNLWIEIKQNGSDTPSWVSYSDGYMACTPSINLFPIVNP